MIIIVEGMDNTGKTTLVEQLVRETGYDRVRSSGPQSLEDMIDKVETCLTSDNIIYDRFPLISEEVYGPALRGYSLWEFSRWREYFIQLLQLKPLFIYCRPARETILRSINQREQLEGVVERASVIIDIYDRVFDHLRRFYPMDVVVHNYREDPLAKNIFQIIKRRERGITMNINDVESPAGVDGDKLEVIFAEQKKLMEKYHDIEKASGLLQTTDIPVDLHSAPGQARLKDFAWRITEELCEALDALSSDSFGNDCKNDRKDDRNHAREEIADAFHFLIEFAILAGIDSSNGYYFHTDVDKPHLDKLDILFEARTTVTTKPPNPSLHVMSFIKSLGMTCHTLKNKPWKQTQILTDVDEFSRRFLLVIKQFIDICIAFGLNSDSLFDLYFRKNQVNQFRQRSKY